MPFVRRNINKCTPSRSNFSRRISGLARPRALVRLLFSVSFLLGGFVIARTPEKGNVLVSFASTKECSKKYYFSGTSINIDGMPVKVRDERGANVFIQLAPGDHVVSGLREPGYPDAKMTAVRVLWRGNVLQERVVDASGSATVTLDAHLFGESYPSIEIVTENDCRNNTAIQEEETQPKDKFEAIKFKVVVEIPDCENPDYKDIEIMIDQTKVTGFGLAGLGICMSCNVELEPGPHLITSPNTSITRVEVRGRFASYAKFFPSQRGVNVMLDEGIWEDRVSGSTDWKLYIYLPYNCDDPDFSIAKILGVSKAEIIAPGADGPKQARVNDRVIRNSTLRTESGGFISLESKHGHLITIGESTEVQTNLIMTARGRRKLEASIKMGGKIQIERVVPEDPSMALGAQGNESSESTGMNVKTPAATITDVETIYMVSHDEKTNLTTVGVEEGKVEVTPVNSSLKPFTLGANQQVQVSDSSVSAITHYSGESTRATGILLYVGIGAAALVGLLVVVAGITFLYRRVNRPPVQPAFQQSGIQVEATPANFASPAVATNEWRCPNPQCGKLVPAGKKFCTACGSTQSGFKVEATAVNIASRAVATHERRCPNPQCGKLVPTAKKFCTACGTPVI